MLSRPREAPALRPVRARGRRRRRPATRSGSAAAASATSSTRSSAAAAAASAAAGRGPGGPPRGSDLEVVADLDFEQAVFGAQAPGDGAHRGRRASTCEATGAAPGTDADHVPRVRRRRARCAGAPVDPRPDGHSSRRAPAAAASARSIAEPCADCRGEGRHDRGARPTPSTSRPASTPARTLRLSGRGAVGPRGGGHGDLYVHVRVAPHERFDARGLRPRATSCPSRSRRPRSAPTSTFDTLDGERGPRRPAGHRRSGRVFRLRGRGVPHVEGRGRGDLLVQVGRRHADRPRRRAGGRCSGSSPSCAARRSRRPTPASSSRIRSAFR